MNTTDTAKALAVLELARLELDSDFNKSIDTLKGTTIESNIKDNWIPVKIDSDILKLAWDCYDVAAKVW